MRSSRTVFCLLAVWCAFVLLPSSAAAQASCSGVAAWTPSVSYTVGVQVTYGGRLYRCQQAHTSQVGWEPPNAPALWALQ